MSGRDGPALLRTAAVVVALGLASCSGPAVTLPPDPAALIKNERYSFGDAYHARDTRAMIAALDALEPTYGKLRTGHRHLPVATSPDDLRRQYAAVLLPAGWTPAPELARWPRHDESYAFGWHSHGKVFAVVGLAHRPWEVSISPVTLISNIGDIHEGL